MSSLPPSPPPPPPPVRPPLVRAEDSVLWQVAPRLAARLNPGDIVAIEPDADEDLTPPKSAVDLLRRLGCPTVAPSARRGKAA